MRLLWTRRRLWVLLVLALLLLVAVGLRLLLPLQRLPLLLNQPRRQTLVRLRQLPLALV